MPCAVFLDDETSVFVRLLAYVLTVIIDIDVVNHFACLAVDDTPRHLGMAQQTRECEGDEAYGEFFHITSGKSFMWRMMCVGTVSSTVSLSHPMPLSHTVWHPILVAGRMSLE